jgi:hypothetical protein
MNARLRSALAVVAGAALFCGGIIVGARHAAQAAAPAPVSQPKTILQLSLIKWRADASEAQKEQIMKEWLEMAGKIPGVKNVWTKPSRMQPQNYHTAYAIEFANREAADRYALDPAHDAWSKKFQAIRETSISPQLTNP